MAIQEMAEDEEKSFKLLGILDVKKIPCARQTVLYGTLGGLGIGLGHFLATSKVRRSYHLGVGGFVLTTFGYWFYCRYNNAKERIKQRMIQEAIKNKILFQGTQFDPTKAVTNTKESR